MGLEMGLVWGDTAAALAPDSDPARLTAIWRAVLAAQGGSTGKGVMRMGKW